MTSQNVDLLLGCPLKEASDKKVLGLFAVTVVARTLEDVYRTKNRSRERAKRIKTLRQLLEVLYKETMRRMRASSKGVRR